MPITLSEKYLSELKKNVNEPVTIIEIAFSGGTRKFGTATGGFSDVAPILASVSSLQNKLDQRTGYSTRGQLKFALLGRDNFKNIVRDEYLKNRRVVRKDGFIAPGFEYSDYADTFTGRISDWSRSGDEITITVTDDLVEATRSVPEENAGQTQFLDYRDTNPIDVIKDLVLRQLEAAGPLKNGDFENWSSGATSAPDEWTLAGAGATVAASTTSSKRGLYNAALTGGSVTSALKQTFADFADYKGKQISFGSWVKSSVASQARLRIDDGVSPVYSSYHTGGGGWEFLTVTRQVSGAATQLEFSVRVAASGTAYFDGAVARDGSSVAPTDLCVNEANFILERDRWFSNWKFDRVITKSEAVNKFLNELQVETNSFVFHDGAAINLKAFAPPFLGETIEEWSDEKHILKDSLSCSSGYRDNFYNRVLVYYDYDESGGDSEEAFSSLHIAVAADSVDASRWGEVKTRTIKSRWIRTRTHNQPVNVTGVTIYNVNAANPLGKGYLEYTFDAVKGERAIRWRSSDGSDFGEPVQVSRSGKYEVKGADPLKLIRAVVDFDALPSANASDEILITHLDGDLYARVLADQYLRRYKDPVASVAFDVGINDVCSDGAFRKVTDLVDLTTDEAFEKGEGSWDKERVMLTGFRPDFGKGRASIEAVETRIYTNNYGFVSPASHTSAWDSATPAEKLYAFVGDANNQLGAANDDGFIIW
jgi:hypothetical protein